MKVPSPTQGGTRPSGRGLGYLQAATPDFSPLIRGFAQLGASLEDRAEAERVNKEQLTKFKTLVDYNEFETGANDMVLGLKKQAKPDQANFREITDTEYENYSNKFLERVAPELQDEYRVKLSDLGQKISIDATDFQLKQQDAYYKQGVNQAHDTAKKIVDSDSSNMEVWKKKVEDQIDASGLREIDKAEMKRLNAEALEGIAYRKAYEQHKVRTSGPSNEIATSIKRAASELGINPIDLATAISYETGGKFSPSLRGGAGNKHIGLIQFGPSEQLKYGARQDQGFDEQMDSVVAYLKDRGLKPGMSLLDLYSTINAGSPGKYNASDAAVGGMPGSVADKVNTQMEGHKGNAAKLFGGTYEVPDDIDSSPRYNNVTYEDRIALRKQGDSNVSDVLTSNAAAAKASQETLKNSLMVGIFDGTMGQKDLDEARNMGLLTDYEDIKKAQDLIDNKDKEGKELRAVQDKLSSRSLWDFTNTDDKNLSNTWFGASGSEALSEGDDSYYKNILKPFVDQTNMIPPNAIGLLDAMTRTTNGKQALFALNALSDLHNTEPDAYERQVPAEVQNNVDFWEARRNIFDEKETLDIIGGRTNLEQRNIRQALSKEADTFFNDPKNDNYTTFDSVLEAMTPDTAMPFESNAQAPVWPAARLEMQNEWKTLVKENYVKSGDWQMAQGLAMKQLQRTWGVTDFGGRQTLMKFPPEKAGYKPLMGSMQWTEDQAREELHIPPNTPIQLISDDVTQSQFMQSQRWESKGYGPNVLTGAAHAMSRPTPPSYLVAVQGPEGWQLATDSENRIIRQHFEVTDELKAQDAAQFKLKEMEYDLQQDYIRLLEMGKHAQVNGTSVPQELIDEYNVKREQVEEFEKSVKVKESPVRQGPERKLPSKGGYPRFGGSPEEVN